MKALLVIVSLLAFLRWRRECFDRCDREHGFGAFADVKPSARAGS